MRVTHVITRLIVGGAQENTVASVLGLRERTGWDATLISGPSLGVAGSLASAFNPQPSALTILPQLVRPIHPWKDWIALRRLAGMFRRSRPEIVHTHSGKAGVLGRLAAAKAGVPIIIHTIHGPSFGPFQGPLANRLFLLAEKRAARVTTHFVTVSDAMTEQYVRAGVGRREQYTKILSGFGLAPYRSTSNDPKRRARWGIAPSDVVIGKIARLFKLKGHDDLVSIAPALLSACPKIRFLLVGDGEWRERIEARTRALGLRDRFVFTGLQAPEQIPGLIGIMDLVVHLSLREGLARALPQALAAGRPVVAYDCDGAREVCLENETGFLVPPHDLSTLTARLLRLVEDRELRERLGRNGQHLVKEQFDVNNMVDRLRDLYLRLTHAAGIPVQ